MLSWLADIQNTQPIAHGVIILSLVAALGLSMGSVRPALAFAHGMCGSEAPSVAYASVYPLTMVLRIVAAQLLVLFFAACRKCGGFDR